MSSRAFKRYGLIYKRACQEHFSPCAGCAGLVRDIQPIGYRRGSWSVVPWVIPSRQMHLH